jgi:hypothetical protein
MPRAAFAVGSRKRWRRSNKRRLFGGVAQLGERLLCKQEVIGSIPFTSTTDRLAQPIVSRAPAALLSLSKGAPRKREASGSTGSGEAEFVGGCGC